MGDIAAGDTDFSEAIQLDASVEPTVNHFRTSLLKELQSS